MVTSDWDAYWRSGRSAAVVKDSGPQDEALKRFWFQFFKPIFSTGSAGARMLDIACGSGAVIRHALVTARSIDRGVAPWIVGLDTSANALRDIRERHPEVHCIEGHAGALPFPGNTFDLVTSQFGVEYAGTDALREAGRVVRPGGCFASIVHLWGGAIYKECAANLDAINSLRNSGLLRCFKAIFRTARAVQGQRTGVAQFRQADQEFAASVSLVEQALQKWGKPVADGLLFRIYNDIAHMYKRYNHYDPEQVYDWIRKAGDELETYSGRMASMVQAAVNDTMMHEIVQGLSGAGLAMRNLEKLTFANTSMPAAWILIYDRIGT